MKIKLYENYTKRNAALYVKFYINHVFVSEIDNAVENVVTDEEEFDGIEKTDGISNLENLPRTMFID